MNTLQKPEVLKLPFANNGQKNDIPLVQTDPNSSNASLTTGFPPITMKPKSDKGIPPEGKDFNGVLYLLSSFYFAFQNGWLPTFDENVSQAIGGYAKGAILWYTSGESRQALQSQKNNNTDNFNQDPSVIGVSWKAIFPDLQTVLENMPIGLSVGDILPNIGSQPPAGRFVCNGQRIAGCKTLFPVFYEYVLSKTPYKTVAEFNSQVSAYGQCGYCAVDGDDVLVPLITRPISGVNTLAQTGMAVNDTMRPIRGSFGTQGDGGILARNPVVSGAFTMDTMWWGSTGTDSNGKTVAQILKLDSARLGAAYNGSETRGKQVMYPYAVVVYTTIPDKATVDVGELVSLVKEQTQLGVQDLPAAGGTIQLASGGIYKGSLVSDTVFSLPQVTDTGNLNQILVQLEITSTVGVIDFGTDYYFSAAPETTAGFYNIIFEFDPLAAKWCVGSIKKTGV